MVDTFSPAKRSRIMRCVRSADTTPEMIVRRLAHRLGYRYRLHVATLPGKPDLVFVSRRKIIFVNGCFWHQHSCARGNRVPASRRDYWEKKLSGNRRRDRRNRAALKRAGWGVLTIWECQTKKPALVERRLRAFLDG